MPRPAVAPETYAEYPLILLSLGRKKKSHGRLLTQIEVSRCVAGGAYVLDVQHRAARLVRAKPQPFTVVSNQTVRVDMNIFTGFR